MTEEKLIKTINTLLLLASMFFFYGVSYKLAEIHDRPTEKAKPKYIKTESVFEIPEPDNHWRAVYSPALEEEMNLRNIWQSLDITYKTIETEYLGRYFITAYCPEECGYNGSNYPKGWTTASGTICHYSESNFEPTTCAIDRRYHKFNEYLMVDGKVYVTEDTGSGVKGLWVDCFVETMSEVRAWDTGYKSVYSVTFKENYLSGKERKILHELINRNLYDRRFSAWSDYRNDNRAYD